MIRDGISIILAKKSNKIIKKKRYILL